MSDELSAAVAAIMGRYHFAGIQAEAVRSLLAALERRELASGAVLFPERSHGSEMFFLTAGRVRITRTDHLGQLHHLADVDAPDLIGQLSLIDNSTRSATATAEGPVTVRVLTRTVYAGLWNATTPAASALRRLLLAALHEQLDRAQARWARTAEARPRPTPSVAAPQLDPDDLVEDELIRSLGEDISR